MDFFIISAERFNLTQEENAKRTMNMVDTLLHEGADFIACKGVYKGTAERSFMVMDTGMETAQLIELLARDFEQESVLEVRELKATLVYVDGTKPEYLGRFEQHTDPIAGLEAYTSIGSKVFVVK